MECRRKESTLLVVPLLCCCGLLASCSFLQPSRAEMQPAPFPMEPTVAPPASPVGEYFPLPQFGAEADVLPPLPEQRPPEQVFADPDPLAVQSLVPMDLPPSLPLTPGFSPCPCGSDCTSGACYRGTDHLGDWLHQHGWTGEGIAQCQENAVLRTHGLFEHLDLSSVVCQPESQDAWVGDREQIRAEQANPVRACLQCKFVNWRLNSMYLAGCMPEGYDLSWFIRTAPSVQFYSGPLSETGVFEPGADAQEVETLAKQGMKPLATISLDIAPPRGELPHDRAKAQFAAVGSRMHLPGTQRLWNSSSFYWNASLLNHQPLYFEDVNVDRHGFTYGWFQPVVSGVKFFATIPTLPYQLIAEPPQTMQYTLGETRPGDHAAYVHQRLPVNADAGLFQAAVIVGLVFLIP